MKFIILSEKEYKETQERLTKGEELIKQNGGFCDAPTRLLWLYQTLADACLMYELANGLLEI
jgi:hypothetical protein